MTRINSLFVPGILAGALVGLTAGVSCNDRGSGTAGTGSGADGAAAETGSGAGTGTGTGDTAESGGTTGSGTGTGGTAGVGGAGTGGAAVGGASGVPPAGTDLKSYNCTIGSTECSDNKDNDGDTLIDWQDPECIAPCDNDEGSFATGIAGDNIDACKQDCFFDGNSGQGDDGCNWDLSCDPANPGKDIRCPYSGSTTGGRCSMATQSQKCIDFCRHVVPNGCDCFGCCEVYANGTPTTVLLLPSCSVAKIADTTACPRCTQNASCINTCGQCEVCLGKPAPDPSCYTTGTGGAPGTGGTPGTGGSGGAAGTGGAGGTGGEPMGGCSAGFQYCGPGGMPCMSGTFCLTGCCVIP